MIIDVIRLEEVVHVVESTRFQSSPNQPLKVNNTFELVIIYTRAQWSSSCCRIILFSCHYKFIFFLWKKFFCLQIASGFKIDSFNILICEKSCFRARQNLFTTLKTTRVNKVNRSFFSVIGSMSFSWKENLLFSFLFCFFIVLKRARRKRKIYFEVKINFDGVDKVFLQQFLELAVEVYGIFYILWFI